MIFTIPGPPSLSYFRAGGVAVAWQKSSWGNLSHPIRSDARRSRIRPSWSEVHPISVGSASAFHPQVTIGVRQRNRDRFPEGAQRRRASGYGTVVEFARGWCGCPVASFQKTTPPLVDRARSPGGGGVTAKRDGQARRRAKTPRSGTRGWPGRVCVNGRPVRRSSIRRANVVDVPVPWVTTRSCDPWSIGGAPPVQVRGQIESRRCEQDSRDRGQTPAVRWRSGAHRRACRRPVASVSFRGGIP